MFVGRRESTNWNDRGNYEDDEKGKNHHQVW